MITPLRAPPNREKGRAFVSLVHACSGETIEHGEHAARLVVNFGEYGFALNECVGASLEHRARLGVVGGLQNDVANLADSTATDGLEINLLALKFTA